MITFIDLGPKATVHLYLTVPVALDGEGWAWGALSAYAGALAREFAYTAPECSALVHAYGRTIGRLLQSGRQPDRFQITARGPVTGLVLGIREYQWSAAEQEFTPAGEYLCGWREAIRAYFELTGELFTGKAFSAQPEGLPTLTERTCWAEDPALTRAA